VAARFLVESVAWFGRHRFTDPDPELLGKVFENLYQGADRHDTGDGGDEARRMHHQVEVR